MLIEMTIFRLSALIVSLVVGYYLLRLVHRQKLSGFEFLFWFSLIVAVMVLSVFPGIIPVIFNYFTLEMNDRYDRLIGLAFVFIALTFVIVFYYRNRLQSFREQFVMIVQAGAIRQFLEKYGAEQGKHELFIIIPAYNEGHNVARVLRKIPAQICGLIPRVMLVSDGSVDNTLEVAEQEGVWTTEHPINFGQGMALVTGYRCATAMQAKYVATIDADGQYQPEELERLLQPVIDGSADMVSGSRFLGHYAQKFSRNHIIRSVGVQVFNVLLTIMMGKKITDSSSGFRAVKVQYLPKLRFVQEQFHSSELLIECLKHGLRFQEVPISFLQRISGASKKPRSLQYGLGFFGTMLRTWIRK